MQITPDNICFFVVTMCLLCKIQKSWSESSKPIKINLIWLSVLAVAHGGTTTPSADPHQPFTIEQISPTPTQTCIFYFAGAASIDISDHFDQKWLYFLKQKKSCFALFLLIEMLFYVMDLLWTDCVCLQRDAQSSAITVALLNQLRLELR